MMEFVKINWTFYFVGIFFLSGHFVFMVHGDVKFYDFVLKETNFTRLCSTKHMLTVNDSFPGPTLYVHKGDTVYVNVHNQGAYGVTLHWHGVKQPRNPWSDGPEYITQCPIHPGTNFTYEVIFSTEEGTLWWHAHSDWTRFSVHGAIVVLPAVGTTYPFPQPDEEEVIVLSSWFKQDVMLLLKSALAIGTDTAHSDALTINGQPGDLCPCSKESTYRRVVDYGKTYLFRVVSGATNTELFFAIAQHNFTVVGTDGAYVKPFVTSYIMISPGQTFDLLITAKQPPGEYYMAARVFFTDYLGVDFDEANATAILQYSGNYTLPSSSPEFPSTLPDYYDFDAFNTFINQIRSLANVEYPVDVPKDITTRMFVTVSMNRLICVNYTCFQLNNTKLASSLNNNSFVNPTTDVLLSYYRNISGYFTTDFPDKPPTFFNFTTDDLTGYDTIIAGQGTKVKVLDYNASVEVIFQDTNVMGGATNHPLHLHGYSFYAVGSGLGNFDNDTDPQGFNLVDPPHVNTFTVPKYGWLAIRFVANNPGVWFWHCHIERHQTWGMNTAFIVKNGGTLETSIRPPPVGLPVCENDPFVMKVQENNDNSQEREKRMNMI